jgi:hypothetical protein
VCPCATRGRSRRIRPPVRWAFRKSISSSIHKGAGNADLCWFERDLVVGSWDGGKEGRRMNGRLVVEQGELL